MKHTGYDDIQQFSQFCSDKATGEACLHDDHKDMTESPVHPCEPGQGK